MKVVRNSAGFTMVELLVVVAIVGVLAAIAIPQFALYRQKAYDARAQADLRNGATAEEALPASGGVYVACATAAACKNPTLPGFSPSSGTTMAFSINGTATTFTGTSKNTLGTGVTCNWDSTNGGLTGCS